MNDVKQLPQWFLDLTINHIEAIKQMIFDPDVCYLIEESWLEGTGQKGLSESHIEFCRQFQELTTLGKNEQLQKKSVYIQNCQFSWYEILQFLRFHEIKILDSSRKRGNWTIIDFYNHEDWRQHNQKITIGLTVNCSCYYSK